MPSRKKTTMFASAFFTCICSFVIICVVLATQHWMSSKVRFSGTNSSITVSLTYGLFSGTCEQFVDVGLQVSERTFQVAENLRNPKTKSMIVAIIVILVLSLLSSLLSSGFTCTNAVSNPYQTFLGPTGVYTWNSLCGIFTLIAMILFPVNIEENGLSVELACGCFSVLQTQIKSEHTYGYSYWIMLLIIFLNITSIIIIYFYDHARYSKKKEQEGPIENAPKDVILF
ncbi:clarin-3 [Haliaeetus albicilla]|uniref:CLRN3 protein n=1 Tax=Haliaeetus albicilla TaxID=8969 RepID=A0A091PQI3_HALAL|nr:PREDICTED: clarin-3 [Haliaeetus albicilla]XP_010580251.1 PREDICTED: clarin-3 [Haliaeetus leucocephalus]KFP97678.1 Clarin-3 [Haliaeetus albicilla]NWZ50950.1 CLRN3 protein [Haliaeetus albicilla]